MNQFIFRHPSQVAANVAIPALLLTVQILCGAVLIGALLFVYAKEIAARSLLCVESVGNTPDQPFTPIDTWIALHEGDQHWYAFRDEGDDTPIRVRLAVVPSDGVTFSVLTPAQMQAWRRGELVDPVGAGSISTVLNGDLYWTGSFVESGTYFVVVESSDQGLRNYMLSIQGARVSFPLITFIQPQPPIATPGSDCAISLRRLSASTGATAPSAPLATVTPGPSNILSSPEEPLPPIGKALPIDEGERHWYAFRDEGDAGAITIRANANPAHCIAFALWTPEQLRLWRQNIVFRAVGEGTVNDQMNGDLFWTGSFVKSGIYHVVVIRDPLISGNCTYQLRVTGEDVSLLLPSRMP